MNTNNVISALLVAASVACGQVDEAGNVERYESRDVGQTSVGLVVKHAAQIDDATLESLMNRVIVVRADEAGADLIVLDESRTILDPFVRIELGDIELAQDYVVAYRVADEVDLIGMVDQIRRDDARMIAFVNGDRSDDLGN